MDKAGVPYEAIVFVCTNAREEGERVSCAHGGRPGAQIRDLLKARAAALGLKGRVRVSASGCMDLCEEGPNVMVFKRTGERVWYKGVSEADVPRILAEVTKG